MCYAGWLKSDSKAKYLHDSIDIIFWKRQNSRDREEFSDFQRERKRMPAKGQEEIGGDDGMVLYIDRSVGYMSVRIS